MCWSLADWQQEKGRAEKQAKQPELPQLCSPLSLELGACSQSSVSSSIKWGLLVAHKSVGRIMDTSHKVFSGEPDAEQVPRAEVTPGQFPCVFWGRGGPFSCCTGQVLGMSVSSWRSQLESEDQGLQGRF